MFRCPLCTFETLFKADVKVHIVKKHTASEVLEKCEGIEKDDYIAALDKVSNFFQIGTYLWILSEDFWYRLVIPKRNA